MEKGETAIIEAQEIWNTVIERLVEDAESMGAWLEVASDVIGEEAAASLKVFDHGTSNWYLIGLAASSRRWAPLKFNVIQPISQEKDVWLCREVSSNKEVKLYGASLSDSPLQFLVGFFYDSTDALVDVQSHILIYGAKCQELEKALISFETLGYKEVVKILKLALEMNRSTKAHGMSVSFKGSSLDFKRRSDY